MNPTLDPMCRCCGEVEETVEHLFDECPTMDHIRYLEIRPEIWHSLPVCTRHHGIVPALLELGSAEDRKELACMVQHTLLDIWRHRCSFRAEEDPRPVARWVGGNGGT